MASPGDPIDGPTLQVTAAKASVAPGRVVPLIDRVQQRLDEQAESLVGAYEVAYEQPGVVTLLVDEKFWRSVGERHGLEHREIDAVRRAHNEQLLRTGRTLGRREEFESALDIRDAVHVQRRPDERC